LFAAGQTLLLELCETNSVANLSLSAVVLGLSILPWCVCMGATYPLMMAGTLLTAIVLVEWLGFRQTLLVAATGNFAIAVASGWLGMRNRGTVAAGAGTVEDRSAIPAPSGPSRLEPRMAKWILFSTGLIAMARKVVWSRATHAGSA